MDGMSKSETFEEQQARLEMALDRVRGSAQATLSECGAATRRAQAAAKQAEAAEALAANLLAEISSLILGLKGGGL